MRHRHPSRTRPSSTLALAMGLLLNAACSPPPADGPGTEPVFFPPANRPDVRGTMGAVASDHPLASAAGMEVLRSGGNAMDAVIAMAGVLAVTRPHMNGVGGDAFALVRDGESGEMYALNGSGRAGMAATADLFQGLEEYPQKGPLTVSVPGAVAAWVDALDRFGSRSMGELLAPAIRYARDGFPVSTRLASDFQAQGGDLNEAGQALYLPGGAPPPVGSLLRNEALAETLERVARQGKAGFYEGPVAETLARFLESQGGHLRVEDFQRHTSTWVEPLSVDYLEHTFHVMPPNTQGLAQLQMMGMAKSFDFSTLGHNTSGYLHALVEVKKLAFADRDRWVADPEWADIPVERLSAPDYLAARAEEVRMDAAADSVPPGLGADGQEGSDPAQADDSGDTVYLTAVDQWGNAVSWIQSLFAGFGSGLLEPTTGVMLQNRAALFTLKVGHPNRVEPGKRPFHTLTPMLATRDGALAFTIGTPGGDSQPQSLLQIVHNLLLFGMTPQEAVEAPRFRSQSGRTLLLEDRISPPVRQELADLGHSVRVVPGWTATFGGAQMIRVEPGSGTLTVAADPRREAYAIAY
jgi:gamma-glutamyltranspeptidase/glutathione hydrolase